MTPFSVIKKAETQIAHVSLCSDDIIRVMIKKQADVDAQQLKILFDVYNQIVEGKAYAYIYYTEDISTTFTDEGRDYAKREEFSFPKICNAIIVTRLAHKIVANFYLKFNKPYYPYKVFNDMNEAEKWCLEQIKIHKQQTKELQVV